MDGGAANTVKYDETCPSMDSYDFGSFTEDINQENSDTPKGEAPDNEITTSKGYKLITSSYKLMTSSYVRPFETPIHDTYIIDF